MRARTSRRSANAHLAPAAATSSLALDGTNSPWSTSSCAIAAGRPGHGCLLPSAGPGRRPRHREDAGDRRRRRGGRAGLPRAASSGRSASSSSSSSVCCSCCRPTPPAISWGRSGFFIVGAAVLGRHRLPGHVAWPSRPTSASPPPPVLGDRDAGMKIAFRTGGARRHGHGRPGPARRLGRSCCSTRATRPRSSRASASAPPCSPCSCGSAAASSPRPPTSAPTWSARSRRASPRTTRATPPRSPTTSVTTSATAPAWPRTCSSRTPSCWSPR